MGQLFCFYELNETSFKNDCAIKFSKRCQGSYNICISFKDYESVEIVSILFKCWISLSLKSQFRLEDEVCFQIKQKYCPSETDQLTKEGNEQRTVPLH